MRVVELQEFETDAPVLINVTKIDFMWRTDDKTVLKIDNTEICVKETVDEIMIKIRG